MKNQNFKKFTFTRSLIKESHLKYYRISTLVIGITILLSGLIINSISKVVYDPLYLRALVVLPFFLVFSISFFSKFVEDNFIFFFNICLNIILIWALYIASKNSYSFSTTIIFILVASINTAAIGKSKNIPWYSLFIMAITIGYLFLSEIPSNIGFTIVMAIIVIHFVTYLVLKSKEDIEKSLIESDRRVRHLVEALGEGIGIIDKENEFIFINPSVSEIFEVESEEIIGKSIMNFLDNSCKQMFTQRRKLDKNNKSNTFEMCIVTPDKKCKTLLITETSYHLAHQNIHGSILVFRDISKRIKAEKELENAKNKAEESDKLKSAFLANMSHEIRTPMNSILGFADLLQMPELSGEEQQAYIEIIQKSGTRMLNIINDIIDISKIEAGLMEVTIQKTNINELLDFTYNFFTPEVKAKELEFSYTKTLPDNDAEINTDPHKLNAIVTNLVKNAIKYTHYGAIEFGYYLSDENKDPRFLVFYVKDTGIGVPLCRQDAIFEHFVQADIEDRHTYQGAGLGLSISKAYVELLGGRIWIESEEGVGSTFFFTLPFSNEILLNSKININNSPDLKKLQQPLSGLKILIVEDDHYSEMLISSIVNEPDNQIILANDGREAVEICQNTSDIDIILMDIKMMYLNGYEATKQIRAFNKEVIIIAQTAFGLTGDRAKAIEAGCDDYISKPINHKELIALINENLKKKLKH